MYARHGGASLHEIPRRLAQASTGPENCRAAVRGDGGLHDSDVACAFKMGGALVVRFGLPHLRLPPNVPC